MERYVYSTTTLLCTTWPYLHQKVHFKSQQHLCTLMFVYLSSPSSVCRRHIPALVHPAKFISFPRPTNWMLLQQQQLATTAGAPPVTQPPPLAFDVDDVQVLLTCCYCHFRHAAVADIDIVRVSSSSSGPHPISHNFLPPPLNSVCTHQGEQLVLLVQQELHALVWPLTNHVRWSTAVHNTASALRAQRLAAVDSTCHSLLMRSDVLRVARPLRTLRVQLHQAAGLARYHRLVRIQVRFDETNLAETARRAPLLAASTRATSTRSARGLHWSTPRIVARELVRVLVTVTPGRRHQLIVGRAIIVIVPVLLLLRTLLRVGVCALFRTHANHTWGMFW